VDKKLNLYLISDSSGETVLTVSKASLVQFPDLEVSEELFLLVRTKEQVDHILELFKKKPGLILYTMGEGAIKDYFLTNCKNLSIPTFSPLDQALKFFSKELNLYPSDTNPGKYKALDKDYYERVEIMNFAIMHDDGQHPEDYDKADIILFGLSRTSKSPTSLYLGQRGYKVANYPLVPGLPFNIPKLDLIMKKKSPLMVGLTIDPEELLKIRRRRLNLLCDSKINPIAHAALKDNYSSEASIVEENLYAKKIFEELDLTIIDVTHKAIEETAAEIINLYNEELG
jgi:regulator of PEP synthase PpsR (kinase-PPPase family)